MTRNFRNIKIAVAAACLAGALTLLVGGLTTGAPVPPRADEKGPAGGQLVKEIEGYKNWTKVNPAPQLMPARVSILCVTVLGRGAVIDGPGNPHRDKYFTVYVNDTGRAAMLQQKSPKFPVGSVIVKEKLPAEDGQTPELLTVMIKQKKGFNPASGDWEYMAVDGTGTKIEGRGKLEHCQSCHLEYKKSDYIFRTYLPAETANSLK